MEFAAKFPFSEKARDYLARENILAVSDEQLELAKGRILLSLRGAETGRKGEERQEIVSYVLARILLGAMNNFAISAKFAANEARNAVKLLQEEGEGAIELLGKEFFPSLELQGEASVAVLDYLKYGGDLANERVEGGRVFFERRAFLSVLRRAIGLKIVDISINPKTLPANIKNFVEELRREVEKINLAPKFKGFQGKYLQLPAIRKILNGVPEGRRYYGSMTLAIACLKDKLPREEAEQVMITYARNCSSSTHPFTEREALASLEWVYKHPAINFSLRTLQEQQLVDEGTLKETASKMKSLRG